MNSPASIIEINESALKNNLRRVHDVAHQSKVLAMIKANGYGHGLVRVAKALEEADAFGVAFLSEAICLRAANIQHRIVLMRGVLTPEELALAQKYHIECVVHQLEQVELLEQQKLSAPVTIWLKINTGMNRLGIAPEELPAIYQRLNKLMITKPLHLLTHFANADEVTHPLTSKQIQLFQELTSGLSDEKSLANSAGILLWREAHANWVRPGLLLYGVSPLSEKIGADHGLKPVMTWRSELISVRMQHKGDAIGYGSAWVCPYDGLVGIVGVGYADGYPRHAGNGTPVLVNNQRANLIGRVSMDMLAVDLRDQPNAKVTDPVILWGEGLPIEHVANNTASTVYELLCNAKLRAG